MMKPARMKNGSARKMKPPEPRCAFITTPTMSAEPMALTQTMPTEASTKPTGTPAATMHEEQRSEQPSRAACAMRCRDTGCATSKSAIATHTTSDASDDGRHDRCASEWPARTMNSASRA